MNFKEIHDRFKELLANPVFAEVSAELNSLSKEFYSLLDKKVVNVADGIEEEESDRDFDTIESLKELLRQYREKREEARKERINQEQKNVEAKKNILAEIMKVISEEENISKAYVQFNELKEAWRNIGSIPSEQHHELQQEFSRLSELFYYNMNIYKELRENDLKKNLSAKAEIIDKLKKIAEEKTNQKEIEAALHVLQYQWEETGAVPKENWEELRTQYWDAVKVINDKLGIFRKEKEERQKEYLEQKEGLVVKVNEIADKSRKTIKDWEKDTETIIALQAEWKTIGYAPREENDRVWGEFRVACDKFFELKKDYYAVLNSANDEHKKKKQELIEKAEALKDSSDWKNTSNALIKLQNDWQKIGSAGKRAEHTLWNKFRAACDHFFNRKKEHFAAQEVHLAENIKKKEDFIASIESMIVEGEDAEKLAKLNSLSQEFKNIGDVPFAERDRLFAAFKNALDKKYEQLNIDPAQKDILIFKSKIESLKASDNAEFLLKKERDFLRGKINHLTDENVKLENNMAFFGKSKNADAMLKEYRDKIEENKKQIDDLKSKLKHIPKAK